MWLGYLYPKGYSQAAIETVIIPPTRRAESHDADVVLVASDFYGGVFRVGEDRLGRGYAARRPQDHVGFLLASRPFGGKSIADMKHQLEQLLHAHG